MTSLENSLIENGFIRFYFDEKLTKYIIPKSYNLSSMGHLEYTYFHKADSIIDKIKNNEPINDSDKKHRVIFGLKQKDKPPTLIYPIPSFLLTIDDTVSEENLDRNLASLSNNIILFSIANYFYNNQ